MEIKVMRNGKGEVTGSHRGQQTFREVPVDGINGYFLEWISHQLTVQQNQGMARGQHTLGLEWRLTGWNQSILVFCCR